MLIRRILPPARRRQHAPNEHLSNDNNNSSNNNNEYLSLSILYIYIYIYLYRTGPRPGNAAARNYFKASKTFNEAYKFIVLLCVLLLS